MESISKEPKIHFYELMEVDILNEYIQSGITYFLNAVLGASHKFVHFRYYTEEIATFLSALKDLYFLIFHRGIYAENFYDLERKQPMSKFKVIGNIVIWHVLPYLHRKIEKIYNEQQERPSKGLLYRLFIALYPYLYCVLGCVQSFMKFRYLVLPQSKYYNLQYKLTKTQVSYISRQEQSVYPLFALLKSPGLFLLLVSHKIAAHFLGRNHNNKGSRGAVLDMEAPIKSKKPKECPICGQRPRNPAVLKVSGYVFCYSCINQFVKKHCLCPVTKLGTDEDQIQLIYQ